MLKRVYLKYNVSQSVVCLSVQHFDPWQNVQRYSQIQNVGFHQKLTHENLPEPEMHELFKEKRPEDSQTQSKETPRKITKCSLSHPVLGKLCEKWKELLLMTCSLEKQSHYYELL